MLIKVEMRWCFLRNSRESGGRKFKGYMLINVCYVEKLMSEQRSNLDQLSKDEKSEGGSFLKNTREQLADIQIFYPQKIL